MLGSFKRLFGGQAKPAEYGSLEDWAAKKGLALRRVRDGEGCVVEGRQGSQDWRAEWGESQRSYIACAEYRLIAEMGLPKDLLALILNRALMEGMEKAVFEQFVEGVQTRLDTETPPEMRWLVMFQKLGGSEMGPLKDRYAALSTVNPWLQTWLTGPLSDAMARAVRHVDADEPVVITISKGRLTLRTAMPEPDPNRMSMWLGIFEHAMREARRSVNEWTDTPQTGTSTQPSSWSHSKAARGDGSTR